MQNPLVIPYHQQDRTRYCGPAVAMMILDAVGANALQQDALHDQLGDGGNAWATSPDHLLSVLNARSAPPYQNAFSRLAGSTAGAVSRGIAGNVAGGIPTVALVFGNGHWVVVTDVDVDANGVVLGFFINSPSLTQLQPPCNHSAADTCGTTLESGGLEQDQYVSYDGWSADFFTGYPDDSGQVVFVAISGAVSAPTTVRVPPATRFPPPARQPDGWIAPELATATARAALTRHKLDSAGPLKDAFENITWGAPKPIKRLYQTRGLYYLVPAFRDGKPVGIVRINGYTSAFLGAAAVRDGNISTFLLAETFDTENFDWVLGRKTSTIDLVWTPSAESRSPFDPLMRIVDKNKRVSYATSRREPFDQPTSLQSNWR